VKKIALVAGLVVLLFGSLFMPFFDVYPHMALGADVAQAFPQGITGLQLILHGNSVLPLSAMPALAAIPFREGLLAAGVILTTIGVLLSFFRRKYTAHAAALIGCAGMLPLLLFAFYSQQLSQSILFDVMLTPKWYQWVPFVLSAALFVLELTALRGLPVLAITDHKWRLVSAALCAVALLMLVFPFATTTITPGTFATPQEDALASRSISGFAWLTRQEPLLEEQASQTGLFAAPADSGLMQELVKLSDSASNVKNLFRIPTHNGTMHSMAIAGVLLLAAGMVLQLLRKVDRWIPASLIIVASLLLLIEAASMLAVDSTYQFQGAAYQLMYLGLGGYTLFPLLMGVIASGAAAGAIVGIQRADSPYFVNPIPQRKRLLAISLVLAVGSAVLLCLPVLQVNIYTPGKVNQANPTISQPMSGLSLLTFQKPGDLMDPANVRGKALYTEEAAKNGMTLADYQALIRGALNKIGILTVIMMAITLLSVGLLFYPKRSKRLITIMLMLSALLQAAEVLISATLIPKDVGFVAGMGAIYAAMSFSVFSAFFANFMDYEELPKKYKLFLMMLPFLVAVFLFAYLPLAGWRYAFYNYKLGLPMDQQEFVGFKWFTSLFANAAQRSETIRVLRNTFAMSGIGLATSWLPVAFAIFLTEIRLGFFKKFVQIFTTLPNFISWVLVFSFALSIFSLDTGIVNKLLLRLGLIDEGVAWLNSGDYIWVKMWLWNTWKSLGWGAIMYLAAIAGIPPELYEAAKVDGAGRWRQIAHVTIPGLLPTFFVLLLLQISNVVNNGMEQYLVFQNAMNKSTIEVLDLYVYNISLGTRSTNTISMATAIGILKSLVSIVLLFAANRFSKWVRGESIV